MAVVRPGDLDAGALYDQHVDFVWRMIERFGVSPGSIEDAVQEVFLIVHRRRSEFRHASSVRTWLGGIAIRVAKDFRRSAERRGHRDGMGATVHDISIGPHEVVEQGQAMKLVLEALDTLDDDQRTVFVLAELEELSTPEIAEVTGANVNTVSSRLRLARKYFNEQIAVLRQKAGGM